MIHPVVTTLANFDFPTLLCIKETHSSRLKGVLCLLGYFYITFHIGLEVGAKSEGAFSFSCP